MSQPKLTFKWSKHVRRWAAFGPAEALATGAVVEVTRGDGSVVLKRIRSVSKPFDVDGVPHAVGFVGDDSICPTCRTTEVPKDADTSPICYRCSAEAMGLLG